MKPIRITYSLAMAASRDAGNRSMREGGRTVWAVADWNVACETFNRIYGNSEREQGGGIQNRAIRRNTEPRGDVAGCVKEIIKS